jgi:lipopolysaccharide transport system ATP-binding protein
MGKKEIARKFDEIVAFAELEKFIDTAVKHYSSGMYVRLAFAVAAHLEPEILLVDEVLAVGDIKFQKKCLGKMGDVARAGRTVVLVSHQLNQIRRLCQRVIWVDGGTVRLNGNAGEVVGAYELAMSSTEEAANRDGGATGKAKFLRWEIAEGESGSANVVSTLGAVAIRFYLEVRQAIRHGHHGIALFNADRQLMWGNSIDGLALDPGVHQLAYEFPMLPVRPGPYTWLVSLYDDDGPVDIWDGVPEMIVTTESHQHARDEWGGILNLPGRLTVDELPGPVAVLRLNSDGRK